MENMSLIPHYMHMREPNLDLYYGRWITKDGLVDAYDNNAMEFVRTYVLLSMNLVEKIKIMLFNLMNVQQKHGNW
jgi:hypothetical protein